MPTHYGFTGQHADNVTGLDYYNARYYDPVAAQFSSADSVLPGNGFDSWGLSRYAYVGGNPESRVDPTGNIIQCVDTCNVDPPATGAATTVTTGQGSTPSAVANTRPAPVQAESGFDHAKRAVAGFLYNPPPWAAWVPGVSENALMAHLLNMMPPDQQETLEFAFAPVTAEAGLELSLLRTEARLDARIAAEGAGDVAPTIRGGVYTLRDVETGAVVRTGRTGNLAAREAAHANDPILGNFRFQAEYHTDDYATQRGLEQVLYGRNPGALLENGGYNTIRAVRIGNPRFDEYMNAAQQFLAQP